MLYVKDMFCCFMCVIVGLTTVDKLEVFHIHFCCFSNINVLLLAINDAMASSPQGCGGALQLIHKCGFWKGDQDFTLVFEKPSVYRAPFLMTSTFTGSRYDVIVLLPLGGAASDSHINGSNTSIVHCFRYNRVLLLTGMDVLVFSPLVGTAGEV